MPFYLKSYQAPPPGLFAYVQRDGIFSIFNPSAIIEDVAKKVSAFRLKNGLNRGSLAESMEDIDAFNCARLENNPNWVFQTDATFAQIHSNHPFIKQHCSTCGTPVK